MASRLDKLRARKAALITESEEILNADAESDGKDTDEQTARDARYEEIQASLDQIDKQIEREEKHAERERTMEALKPADDDDDDPDQVVHAQPKRKAEDFSTFGDQLLAVYRHQIDGVTDRRLIYGAATGLSEGVPSEGGFLVQRDFSTELLTESHELGDILSRTRKIPISVNSDGIKLPAVDESSRVDGSRWGGVQAYWANEADTVTSSRPKFREIEMTLKKLFGLAYTTDELMRDAVALENIIRTAFLEELVFKTEDAVVNGTGSGQMLGLLNSGAVITVAKEGSQAAATVVTNNILKMFSRLPRRSRRNAVWLINQDIEPQLYAMTLGSGTAVVLLYRPPGVEGPNVGSPFGTLLGRPVIPVEYNATLGTAGDIILCDLTQYLMIDKEGIRQDSSMHVRFVNDETAFRFIYRVDGQPAWKVPVTPKNGTATQSPFINLATRA